tara:strand:- start:1545 stop:1742 length:198 start_codon:yes stop_codon:yes gene_type:complete
MSTINLNKRGNCMPSGKKSIKLFYKEMIEECKKNVGKNTAFGTEIDDKFITILEQRLKQLNYDLV